MADHKLVINISILELLLSLTCVTGCVKILISGR